MTSFDDFSCAIWQENIGATRTRVNNPIKRYIERLIWQLVVQRLLTNNKFCNLRLQDTVAVVRRSLES